MYTNKHKIIFSKISFHSILILWFFLCILPGDCLLLGCTEEAVSHYTVNESITITNSSSNCFTPEDNPHCTICCLLCTHNLTIHLQQSPSLTFTGPSYRLRGSLLKYFDTIFQNTFYRPPR